MCRLKYVYKPININAEFTVMAWQCISPEVTWVLRSAVHPMQWICCGMAIKKMGMLRVSIKKMEVLTVKESDTDEGR